MRALALAWKAERLAPEDVGPSADLAAVIGRLDQALAMLRASSAAAAASHVAAAAVAPFAAPGPAVLQLATLTALTVASVSRWVGGY